jgi:hypothetical protein
MSLTYEEAVDDISAMMLAAWTPTDNSLYWEDVQKERDKSNNPWAVFVIRHATGSQKTLGGTGKRMFERTGTAIASIFTPTGNGLSDSYILAKVVANAYEGKSSDNGVWFKNVRIQEVPSEGQFRQLNVLMDFEYTETK